MIPRRKNVQILDFITFMSSRTWCNNLPPYLGTQHKSPNPYSCFQQTRTFHKKTPNKTARRRHMVLGMLNPATTTPRVILKPKNAVANVFFLSVCN